MASMIELSIQIQHTKKVITEGESEVNTNKTRVTISNVYVLTCIGAAIYFFIMLGFLIGVNIKTTISPKFKTVYGSTTSLLFVIDSIGLLKTTY